MVSHRRATRPQDNAHTAPQAGFTLIELMIAVVIVFTLSVAAIGSYQKYMNQGRKTEVLGMFAEIRAKEEAYRAEFSIYTPLGANEDDFYPKLLAGNEPSPKLWQASAPASWGYLGISPGRSQLYCGYTVVTGTPSQMPGGRGAALYASAPPATVWWYATGTCDNDNVSTVNVMYMTASDRDVVTEQNTNR